MRGLSDNFINCLKSGLLQPLLERVKKDDTLMLGIRDGYFNIYYRGGSLLKIIEQEKIQVSYNLFFDKKYDLSGGNKTYNSLSLPEKVTGSEQVNKWVSSIASLKEFMDFWFSKHSKMEREFQQLVERENNRSSISGETEYFITDIEFADRSIGARFDMLAIRWPATGRKDGKKCRASFIEIKYGDNALSGKSGLMKHIADINKFLTNKKNYEAILEVMTAQFNQLDKLGLIKFHHCTNDTKVVLSPTYKPELIFLIANHNPRSDKLKNILIQPEFTEHITSNFDLRFFVSSDSGYGMHISNMLSYEQYIKRL